MAVIVALYFICRHIRKDHCILCWFNVPYYPYYRLMGLSKIICEGFVFKNQDKPEICPRKIFIATPYHWCLVDHL